MPSYDARLPLLAERSLQLRAEPNPKRTFAASIGVAARYWAEAFAKVPGAFCASPRENISIEINSFS